MKNHRILLAGALAFVFNVYSVTAQGTAFTYQGRLQNNGNPASGSYDLVFTLFGTNTGGVPLAAPVTNSATAVSNGLFTTTIDFGPDVFTGASNWLEIDVRTNGIGTFTLLTPRQQLTPTPYAIFASDANTVSGTVSATQLSGTIPGAVTVPVTSLTGVVPIAQLPANLVTNGASGVNISGTFTGNGAGITNVGLGSLNAYGDILWGNFVLSSSPSVGAGVGAASVVAADLNGDGHLDLAAANFNSNTVTIFTNNGFGGFVSNATVAVGPGPACVIAADVNGDGHVDLITANFNAGTVTILTNNGFGIFHPNATVMVGSGPNCVCAADVNGDGHIDLITANQNGSTLTVLTNNGSGMFGSNATIQVGLSPVSVTAVDVNGDGHVDLIAANIEGNTLTVLTNNGFGGFAASATLPVGVYPDCVIAADVNGDGKPDLICANFYGNTLTIWTNNGFGGFGSNTAVTVGVEPESVATADVNGDGHVDLICANFNGGTLEILTNNGFGAFGSNNTLQVGTGPECVIAADVNGDGKADLISANNNSSTLSIFLNQPIYTGNFSGNGGGLTNLNAAALSGNATLNNLSLTAALTFPNINQDVILSGLVNNPDYYYYYGSDLFLYADGNFNYYSGGAGNESAGVSDNTGVGGGALTYNAGNDNTALGASALLYAVTVNNNTAIGFASLYKNAHGNNNTALGYYAGSSFTTTESNNIDIGSAGMSGDNNITRIGTPGIQTNTVIAGVISGDGSGLTNLNAAQLQGTLAGPLTVPLVSPGNPDVIETENDNLLLYADASQNSLSGFAGNPYFTGGDNTGMGSGALGNNSSGNDNTAVGAGALFSNGDGNNNTAFGFNALDATFNASNNTAIGSGALYNQNFFLTQITGNIALGYHAGSTFNSTESNNIDIGSPGATGDNNTIRIGTPGVQTQTYLAGTNYFSKPVGIVSTSPEGLLEIQGGGQNTGSGDQKDIALAYSQGGYRHWIRSRHNTAPVDNAIDFFVNNSATAAGSTGPGVGSILTMSLNGGNVGIGTAEPAATLDVAGSLRVNSGTTFTNLQAGQAQMPGTSGTQTNSLTFTFPKTFNTTPKVIATISADPNYNVGDTFVVSVRSVTTTTCVVNIVRVDSAAGWGQILRVNWMAWE